MKSRLYRQAAQIIAAYHRYLQAIADFDTQFPGILTYDPFCPFSIQKKTIQSLITDLAGIERDLLNSTNMKELSKNFNWIISTTASPKKEQQILLSPDRIANIPESQRPRVKKFILSINNIFDEIGKEYKAFVDCFRKILNETDGLMKEKVLYQQDVCCYGPLNTTNSNSVMGESPSTPSTSQKSSLPVNSMLLTLLLTHLPSQKRPSVKKAPSAPVDSPAAMNPNELPTWICAYFKNPLLLMLQKTILGKRGRPSSDSEPTSGSSDSPPPVKMCKTEKKR